jgi:hypothetical protein
MDGAYRINHVGFFIVISIVMLLFIYGVQKLSAEISLRQLKAFLNDLEANHLAQTGLIEQRKKKMRWIFITGIILLIVLLVLGIFKMLSML